MGIAFDDSAADGLISAADSAERVLRSEGGFLGGAVDRAMEDFSGGYARLFTEACTARTEDRGGLAGVLAALADNIRDAKLKAHEEKTRQKELAAWQHRADVREQELWAGDLVHKSVALASMVIDPMPPDTPVPAPTIAAAFSANDRGRFAGGSGDGGTSSADPGKLRAFASQSRASDNTLNAAFSSVRNAWSGFTASCSWVNIEAATFVSGFEKLLSENAADAAWVEQIATAFENAGGGSLGDAVLNGIFIGYASPGQVSLNDIAALNAAQLKTWLGNTINAARLQKLLSQPGLDPGVTAKWWAGLGQTLDSDTGKVTVGEKQHLLIDALPEIIGNLNGVTATARDVANRKRLIAEQERINAELARTPEFLHTGTGEPMPNPNWADLQTQQQALTGITEAIRNAGGTGSAFLLGFGLTHGSPKAQVSAGNPDTAQNVTYAVSGMLITPQSGLNDWATNANNLKRQQQLLSRGESFAVVAWINYDPPTVATVNSGDAARAGADRFVADLRGFNAVREDLGNRTPETLNVLGHSYGTTVTSNALAAAQLRVASFTMLGSAGIEKEIQNTGELHVPAGQVYASEAKADDLASWGRFQRQDPRMESFDAKVFSSEDANIDGTYYQGTTEHNSLVHRKNGDGYGYLDKNTTALYEAALTTTGHGDRILPGERPVSPRAGVAGH
jgi:pimeloyl-ACP methyl ester carboxylesterase